MRNKMLTVMFVAYLLIFAIGSIIAKDRTFSNLENRELAKLPKISGKTILDGSFTEDFESYMSDQIIGKDTLMQLKVSVNRVLHQSYINGVYFGKDDILIQEYNNPYNQLTKNLEYVNEFADENEDLEITWLVVPNACYIYEDKLPAYGTCYDQQEVLAYLLGSVSEKINYVDCSNALLGAKGEYIFYLTDHHWTMNGAYLGYTVLCKAMGLSATPKEDYEITVGSDDFLGTLYSKAPTFTPKADEIILYNNPNGIYTVEYDDGTVSDSLYNMENLEIKDKYTTYLDGNHAYLKITSNSENQEKLLVVKDSYAHSLLPLLADNFSEIYVVDLRYYHQGVSELATAEGITKVLFINNLDFLSTDNNFLWLY